MSASGAARLRMAKAHKHTIHPGRDIDGSLRSRKDRAPARPGSTGALGSIKEMCGREKASAPGQLGKGDRLEPQVPDRRRRHVDEDPLAVDLVGAHEAV